MVRLLNVCCSELQTSQCVQRGVVCCSAFQCVPLSCSMLQCVAVYCGVLQCVAMGGLLRVYVSISEIWGGYD